MSHQHPLVELSLAALGRLAKVPRFGEPAHGEDAELEKIWVRAPLSVAIGGAVSARTELFNYLCGKKVLDPDGRQGGCAGLRIRRGRSTRFKATRDDGTIEEHLLPPEQADDDALRMRAEAAEAEVKERKLALQRVEHALPRAARARPRGLMIWLWPIWWLLTRKHRRVLADRRFTELAYDQACDAREAANRELEEAEQRIRVQRGRFFESLRALSSGPPLGSNVREVELVLGEGPLPEGVELIELTRSSQASELVDAIFLVEKDRLHAPHGDEGTALAVGKINDVIPTLPLMLGKARALVIARTARDVIEPALELLDDEVNDTEEGFRLRIERLEAMQILDANEFTRTVLANIKPQIAQSIHMVIEHGAAHLGAELQRLGHEWQSGIAMTQTNDELKVAVQRIEQSAPLDAKRIAEEVRLLVMGGAAGAAYDLYPELLGTLKPHGLEENPPKAAPPLPALELLPSLTNASPAKLSGAAGWLGGLLRSFESRRADVMQKAQARMEHLREVANAEILDAEPKLFQAIDHALNAFVMTAISRQEAWLDGAMTLERETVAREGQELAPLARARDLLKRDIGKLLAGIAALEKENAGLAAAAAANPVISAA
ncbi:MAG TPA: hypothetical protein VFV99_20965 [Kofleriaceae bacterium]|nr:hypothetical protein [Kofleriaceae bacterium]